MHPRLRIGFPLVSLGLFTLADSAPAQGIHGVVLEELSGAAVPGAYVALIDTAGAVRNAVLADSAGRFLVITPGPGRYDLWVFHLGFAPALSRGHDVAADRALEVELRLAAAPIALDSIVVTADRRRIRLERAGYYLRQSMGFGYFLTRKDIEERSATLFSDLLLGIPGVSIRQARPGQSEIVFRGVGRPCHPQLIVDGRPLLALNPGGSHLLMPQGSGGGSTMPPLPFSIDDLLSPLEVEAVEVYVGPAGMPFHLGATSVCGAILVWLK